MVINSAIESTQEFKKYQQLILFQRSVLIIEEQIGSPSFYSVLYVLFLLSKTALDINIDCRVSFQQCPSL